MSIDLRKDQDLALRIVYFSLGVVVPLATGLILTNTGFTTGSRRRRRIDQAHDITVEDSFPASDPPSSW